MDVGSLAFSLTQVIERINPGVFCSWITSRPGAEHQRMNAWRAPKRMKTVWATEKIVPTTACPSSWNSCSKAPGKWRVGKRTFREAAFMDVFWLVLANHPKGFFGGWARESYYGEESASFRDVRSDGVFLVPTSLHMFSRGEGGGFVPHSHS